MTDVLKLYILLAGYEIIRKSGCIRGEQPNVVLALPVCCYLLETKHGFVLFDTGLDSRLLQDGSASRARFVNDTFPAPPIVLPEHEVLPQLARLGVTPSDVKDIILSHAHSDHTGHLRAFPDARVTIQKLEYEAALADKDRKNFEEYGTPDIRWNVVHGDTRLMTGLDLVLTPGHQQGHQSAVVRLPNAGVKIIVVDVAELLENFEREVLGASMDDAAALASIRKLKAIARETGGELVPLHDPKFVQIARLAPAFYD